MNLCTVISEKFISQAVNLIQSYKVFSYNKKVFLYHFNTSPEKLKIFNKLFDNQVVLTEVEDICDHALSPRVFFYKVFAIRNCIKEKSSSFIYSDSANCFVKEAKNIHMDLVDDSLFLSYPYERLTNQYWTTKRCFDLMEANGAQIMPQYWAGFQVYRKTKENIQFVEEMYQYMLDPLVALPDTTVKKPDGQTSKCIEHRQDQSVFSLLIHKHNRHQFYDIVRNGKYGDWQTFMHFDSNYKHDFKNMTLSPRESKFGNFRFLNA